MMMNADLLAMELGARRRRARLEEEAATERLLQPLRSTVHWSLRQLLSFGHSTGQWVSTNKACCPAQ